MLPVLHEWLVPPCCWCARIGLYMCTARCILLSTPWRPQAKVKMIAWYRNSIVFQYPLLLWNNFKSPFIVISFIFCLLFFFCFFWLIFCHLYLFVSVNVEYSEILLNSLSLYYLLSWDLSKRKGHIIFVLFWILYYLFGYGYDSCNVRYTTLSSCQ